MRGEGERVGGGERGRWTMPTCSTHMYMYISHGQYLLLLFLTYLYCKLEGEGREKGGRREGGGREGGREGGRREGGGRYRGREGRREGGREGEREGGKEGKETG